MAPGVVRDVDDCERVPSIESACRAETPELCRKLPSQPHIL